MSRFILLIMASVIVCTLPSRPLMNPSTEMVGPVSFLAGGGASGLVSLACVVGSACSCLVNFALPELRLPGGEPAFDGASGDARAGMPSSMTRQATENDTRDHG